MQNLQTMLKQIRVKILRPKTKLNLVDWADQFRYLSPESSAEPGKWRTERVAVARGPMLAVTDPAVHTITIQACTQLAKTELINNIVGYHIHQDPAPIIVMQPTESMAETWSKERLDPMIRDCPVLNELVADKKSRESGNTIFQKKFVGGFINMIGANSPSELAMRPVRIILCDEVDKYPASSGNEGDPISLISERSATFWNRKLVHVCSPTLDGTSRINQAFKESDQREYHVPCPACKKTQIMEWENVQWPKGLPREAKYYCTHCNHPWTEPERLAAIAGGEFIAAADFNGHAGFKISKLSSPWETLGALAQKYVKAVKKTETHKAFINTQLADTWKEKSEVPDWNRLYERRENYEFNVVPRGGLFITAGVDIQQNRIEIELKAWGREKVSWSIDYRIIEGDTATERPWRELEKILFESWKIEKSGAAIGLKMMAVDSGYNTQTVYNWVRKFNSTRVIAVKGFDQLDTNIGTPKAVDIKVSGKVHKRGVKLWPVGVSVIKQEIYAALRQNKAVDGETDPYGFLHYPMYGEEHFKQLTAEELVTLKDKKGYSKQQWQKTRDRNEALDTAVYCRAAAAICGIDRFRDSDWQVLESKMVQYAPPENIKKPDAVTAPVERKQQITRRKGSWL